MKRLKVGERYKVCGDLEEEGNIIEITKIKGNMFYYKTIIGEPSIRSNFENNSLFHRSLECVHSNETIVIYRKGNEMIALDKVTGKKAVAKCSTDDTFDYKVGAKLAFERLIDEPEENGNFKVLCVDDIKKRRYGVIFKKGNVYEYVNGRCVNCENKEWVSKEHYTFNNLILTNPIYVGKLFEVKEVKRKANKGEYVKIVNACCVPITNRKGEYKNGDILKIIDDYYCFSDYVRYSEGTAGDGKNRVIKNTEYVVLEGDYPKEIDTYYNGKIIFTKGDDTFETGHIYEVNDGIIMLEDGRNNPHYGEPLKDIEDVKDYFTAASRRKRVCGWSEETLEFIEVKE